MKRVILCFAVASAVLLSSAPGASAATFDIRAKWRSCQNGTAGLSFRTEFTNPAEWYGADKYLIKSEIRWDKYGYSGWRNIDHNTIQTDWLRITNPEYDFGLSHGDRTNWGKLFDKRWRAHVIVKLIKNWPGPKDKRVETVERFFERPAFRERDPCDEGIWLP